MVDFFFYVFIFLFVCFLISGLGNQKETLFGLSFDLNKKKLIFFMGSLPLLLCLSLHDYMCVYMCAHVQIHIFWVILRDFRGILL